MDEGKGMIASLPWVVVELRNSPQIYLQMN